MALTTTDTDSDEAGAGPRKARKTQVRPRPIPELLLVAGLFFAYKLGRIAAAGHVSRAFDNAHRVWHLERIIHLPSEVTIQHLLLSSEWLVHTANVYYATVHFPTTMTFLIWIYIWRPAHYVWIRRLMAATTGLALAVHLVFPLAPPRMLTNIGMIDTAARYGPTVYGPPSTDTLANQYAAMPSLHVGWALIVAIGLVCTTRGWWRWLWLAYPAATFFVVVGTANHYWLDGIAGSAIVLALLPLIRRLTPVAAAEPIAEAVKAESEPAAYPTQSVPGQRPSYKQSPSYEQPARPPQRP